MRFVWWTLAAFAAIVVLRLLGRGLNAWFTEYEERRYQRALDAGKMYRPLGEGRIADVIGTMLMWIVWGIGLAIVASVVIGFIALGSD